MRDILRPPQILALLFLLGVAAIAQQANPSPPTQVISTRQIDRYHAIEQVRHDLEQDPKILSDWVLLGELAQEVAEDAPPDRAPGYYRLARESFDNALKLQPENAALKAAAAFAREQEQGAESFGKARRQATTSYLEARRRELAQTGNAPSVRVYSPPVQPTEPVAAPRYPYQPYLGQGGEPYTYRQHYDSFFGPVERRTPSQVITGTERAALVKPGDRAAPP